MLDVAAWKFYVLPTATIEREFGEQKTVALGPIQRLVVPVGYGGLKAEVDKVVERD